MRSGVLGDAQDFLDRRIVADELHGLAPTLAGGGLVRVREMAPEAVAAVDRATAGGDQQGTSTVFLDDAGPGPGRAE